MIFSLEVKDLVTRLIIILVLKNKYINLSIVLRLFWLFSYKASKKCLVVLYSKVIQFVIFLVKYFKIFKWNTLFSAYSVGYIFWVWLVDVGIIVLHLVSWDVLRNVSHSVVYTWNFFSHIKFFEYLSLRIGYGKWHDSSLICCTYLRVCFLCSMVTTLKEDLCVFLVFCWKHNKCADQSNCVVGSVNLELLHLIILEHCLIHEKWFSHLGELFLKWSDLHFK